MADDLRWLFVSFITYNEIQSYCSSAQRYKFPSAAKLNCWARCSESTRALQGGDSICRSLISVSGFKARREKMRELVSDQWAISKWVGSDIGLITGPILERHTRQNHSVCVNKFSLWAMTRYVICFILAAASGEKQKQSRTLIIASHL